MTGDHAQQVLQAQRLQVLRGPGRRLVWEEGEQCVFDGEQALRNCQPHRRGSETLGQREEHVRALRRIRLPPALGNHCPMPQQHQAVHLVHLAVQGVDELEQGRGREAL